MFSWFNAAEAKAFGTELADFLIEKMPVETAGNKNKVIAKRKDALDKAMMKVQVFKQTHKLNTYKKAQLGNVFKWRLKEAGYDATIVDDLTSLLLTQL